MKVGRLRSPCHLLEKLRFQRGVSFSFPPAQAVIVFHGVGIFQTLLLCFLKHLPHLLTCSSAPLPPLISILYCCCSGSIQAWEFNVWHGCIDIFSFTHCPSAGFRSHRISSHFHPYPHPYPTPTWLFFPIVSVLSGCPGADVQPKTRGRRQNFIPFNGTVTAPGQSCLLAIVARR